jgi:hypothetical protein
MSIIVIAVVPYPHMAIAEINGGRRGLVFQGDPADAVNALDTRLAELHNQGHSVILACEVPKSPASRATVARARSLAAYHGVRLAMQEPGSEYFVARDEWLQRAELRTLPSEVGGPSPCWVDHAMRHALLAMSRYFPEHFDSIMAYAKGDPIS